MLTFARPTFSWARVGIRTWITEPICAPLFLASVYEASTSSGLD